MGGSPPQQNPNLLQPGVLGYNVQPGWGGGFDPNMPDAHGNSPDSLSNHSAQAVPMTMNVEDWYVLLVV